MVSLGEIARQAGVRPPLPASGTASTGATGQGQIPILHEPIPSPVPAVPSYASGSQNGHNGKTAERSSSAIDLYERAIRDAERASDEEEQANREYYAPTYVCRQY
jgi:hypothetical protein